MALITRVGRLFRADLHAVLDRVEEPEALLRQAIREMEEQLAEERQRLRLTRHEHGELAAREADLERRLAAIDGELDVCFESGEEGLARATTRRKLEAARLLELVARRRQTLSENARGLELRLEENQARLEGLRQKADLLGAEEPASDEREPWNVAPVRDDELEVAFLRERQRRSS